MSQPVVTTIKLSISNEFKWAVQDRDKQWFLYSHKPLQHRATWAPSSGTFKKVEYFEIDFNGDWKDSLHKVKNNKLYPMNKSWIPRKNTKVMVKPKEQDDWVRRYSSGKLDENGNLLCYYSGGNSWSSYGCTSAWKYWRKPTKQELT